MQIIIKNISGSMSTRSTSICKDPNVAKHLSLLHDKYGIVSGDKAPNNIVFVCKSHCVDCLIKELGIDNSLDNPTYKCIFRRHLRKRKSWTSIDLFYAPLEFQPKMKNWIYHHSTGFLNYASFPSIFSRGLSIDASYQVSVHLAKRFERRRFEKSTNQKQELLMMAMFFNGSGRNVQS